jgi:hypothetical protein
MVRVSKLMDHVKPGKPLASMNHTCQSSSSIKSSPKMWKVPLRLVSFCLALWKMKSAIFLIMGLRIESM